MTQFGAYRVFKFWVFLSSIQPAVSQLPTIAKQNKIVFEFEFEFTYTTLQTAVFTPLGYSYYHLKRSANGRGLKNHPKDYYQKLTY